MSDVALYMNETVYKRVLFLKCQQRLHPNKTDAFKYDLKFTKSAEEIKSIYLSVYNSIVLMEYDLIYMGIFNIID